MPDPRAPRVSRDVAGERESSFESLVRRLRILDPSIDDEEVETFRSSWTEGWDEADDDQRAEIAGHLDTLVAASDETLLRMLAVERGDDPDGFDFSYGVADLNPGAAAMGVIGDGPTGPQEPPAGPTAPQVPDGGDDGAQGDTGGVDDEPPAPSTPDPSDPIDIEWSVPRLLQAVGDRRDLAAAVLDAERRRASTSGEPIRKTLVGPLEELIGDGAPQS